VRPDKHLPRHKTNGGKKTKNAIDMNNYVVKSDLKEIVSNIGQDVLTLKIFVKNNQKARVNFWMS
jgi:hypothetical protein